jgi:hypothetical protein
MDYAHRNISTASNAPSLETFMFVDQNEMKHLIIFTFFPTKGNPVSVFMYQAAQTSIAASF